MKISLRFLFRYNQLAGELLRSFSKEKPGKNIVFSPFSIISMLSVLADATGGHTREEILTAVCDWVKLEGLPEHIRKTGKELSRIDSGNTLTDIKNSSRKPIPADSSRKPVPEDNSRHLATANMIFVREDYQRDILPEFSRYFHEQYDGMVIESKDIDAAMKAIYTMLDSGRLEVPENQANSQNILTLFSAAFFEAMWMDQYKDRDVKEDLFINSDGTKSWVNLLYSTDSAYIATEQAAGFTRDFRQCEYSLMALLPKKKGPEALQNLMKKFDLENFLKQRKDATVQTAIPEFTNEYEQNLKQACTELGITEAFTQNADFSPMSKFTLPPRNLTHRAKIKMDRNGAGAKAATKAPLHMNHYLPKPNDIVLNRPFVFAIYHRSLKIPVFIGVVNQIENN